MKTNLILKNSFVAVIAALGLLACTPDEIKSGNTLTQGDLDASFTTVKTADNRYTVTAANDPNVQYHVWKWTTTDGTVGGTAGESKGTITKDFIFPTPGTYTVQHRVVGRTAGTSFVSEQSFVVETFALEDNIVASPNFENTADWTVLNISNNNAVVWTFNNGSATVSGGDTSYSGKGIFQAVPVTKGTYLLDMHVEGAGSRDTWFEAYASSTRPSQGSDYTTGGIKLGLNTWTGCGGSPFNGQFAALACTGSGANVVVPEDGILYIVVKSGSGQNNGINSITISNVALRKYIE